MITERANAAIPHVQWREIAQAFTRPTLAEVAQRGCAAGVRGRLQAAGLPVPDGLSLAQVLDQALNGLRQHYRCEYVYKSTITNRIVFGRHSPRTASLHVELPVGRSIVDLAVYNGHSTAYEIKTELDSHRRLVSQTPDYLRAFERVIVVTHPQLIERYLTVLDERVGVMTLSASGSLTEVRAPFADTDRLDPSVLFRLLRSAEYRAALEAHFGPQPKLANGRQFQHFFHLWQTLPVAEAHRITKEALRARTTDQDTVAWVRQLPASWRVLGYATPLSGVQRQRLLKALS
ncbi:sce7726 family protein [Luteibacter anthropi]|uniref:Sce7726 family protein n=2 Tax=Luteibacter anthropi TaxID=564369 RepID=A0A7X5UD32_9GAMM|nr:sce7726 family protein [Luteibacter anthropi]